MSPSPSTWPARRWAALVTLCLIQLMVVVDVTVVSIALPEAQRDLSFSLGDRQWVITAYALAFGSLLLLGGRLSDVWGRRPTLLVGLWGFVGASALGGDAHAFSTLVAARALQGAFGALLAPAALATLSDSFSDARERARAFTLFGAVTGSGAAVGLILGGALTQWASWRWCLDFNLVVAALAAVGVLAWVPATRAPRRANLDALGTLLSAGGLFLVVYGFSAAVHRGWADESAWGSLVGGGALLVGFVAWQRRAPSPLLPLRLLLSRTRGGSQVALFATSLAVFSLTLFLAYYLENTLHYSPLRTGVYFLPLVGALAVSASVASARLLAMVGPRPLVPVGMLLGMLGMALFTKLTPGPDYAGAVLPGLVLTGLGLGLIIAPATASATSGVDRRDAGAASALVNTAQQVGASIGTALLNTIAVTVTSRYLRAGGPGATDLTAATLHGYRVAFWWAAGFFGAGALASAILLESGATRAEPEAEAEPAAPA